jgi:cellobiose PTS system EIIC component
MQKLINFMNERFTPFFNTFTRNIWVSSITDSIMGVLPLILVGSLITLISIINNYVPGFPNLYNISNFTFGLMSLFIVFLIPYHVLEKKKQNNKKIIAGLTGAALFLMILAPTFDDMGGLTFSFERLGANGMFVSLAIGLLVAFVMNAAAKFTFFKKGSSLPDFIMVWFDTIIPISILMLFGWVMVDQLSIDLYGVILSAFEPLSTIGQSFFGFVFITFFGIFLYTFGISAWALYPITFPIWVAGIEANTAAVALGNAATNVHTFEVLMGWIWLGGMGSTLTLSILMIFAARSKYLKAIGKVTIVPAIFNINEPMIFGAPIAFNPILMIPMWLNGLILPAITYLVFNLNLVTLPSQVNQLWYLPIGISTYLVNSDLRGLFLLALNLAVSFIIWYPFFKVYDNQKQKEEV